MSEVSQVGQVVSALTRALLEFESSVCQGIVKAASKQVCRPRGIVVVGDVTHEWDPPNVTHLQNFFRHNVLACRVDWSWSDWHPARAGRTARTV